MIYSSLLLFTSVKNQCRPLRDLLGPPTLPYLLLHLHVLPHILPVPLDLFPLPLKPLQLCLQPPDLLLLAPVGLLCESLQPLILLLDPHQLPKHLRELLPCLFIGSPLLASSLNGFPDLGIQLNKP